MEWTHINAHYSNAHSVWTDVMRIITHHNAHCWTSVDKPLYWAMYNKQRPKLAGGFQCSKLRQPVHSQKVCIVQKILAGSSPTRCKEPPPNLNEKVAHTTLTDVREVMPKCVVTVIFFFYSHQS